MISNTHTNTFYCIRNSSLRVKTPTTPCERSLSMSSRSLHLQYIGAELCYVIYRMEQVTFSKTDLKTFFSSEMNSKLTLSYKSILSFSHLFDPKGARNLTVCLKFTEHSAQKLEYSLYEMSFFLVNHD